jgi:threonine/homoserine/homoserine lactone efflux protein
MLLLSMGQFFGYLRLLPVPLIQGERVGTRIISVVLVFLFILGAERFQRWLEQGAFERLRQAGLILAFALMVEELWTNVKIWNIPNAVKLYWWVYFDRKKWFVRNDFSDTTYIALVVGGLVLSVLTIAGLAVLAWREERRRKALALPKKPGILPKF